MSLISIGSSAGGLSLEYAFVCVFVFVFVSALAFIHGGGFLLVGQVVLLARRAKRGKFST